MKQIQKKDGIKKVYGMAIRVRIKLRLEPSWPLIRYQFH